MIAEITLTPESFALLRRIIADARNWDNTPMLDITKKEAGNLTDLKRKNLLHTFESDGLEWVVFDFTGIIAVNGVRFANDGSCACEIG